jgi:hypothetical protein
MTVECVLPIILGRRRRRRRRGRRRRFNDVGVLVLNDLHARCCVTLAEVLAEKPTKLGGAQWSVSMRSRCMDRYTDLPVPVGPQKSTGELFLMARSARNRYRTVSMVGTMMFLKGVSAARD